MKFIKTGFIFLFVLIAFWVIGTSQSFARGVITFGPGEMKIEGSIPYTVLGEYNARFSDFKGRITLDENSQKIRSVYLEIEVNSIHSSCPWCDKVIRSKRLLNTARYPEIVFISHQVIQDEDGYKVKGVLELHGVKRKMIFPFKVENTIFQNTKDRWLDISGSWRINRKDFNIVWSKTLDRGGVLVGNIFTVNWRISLKAFT